MIRLMYGNSVNVKVILYKLNSLGEKEFLNASLLTDLEVILVSPTTTPKTFDSSIIDSEGVVSVPFDGTESLGSYSLRVIAMNGVDKISVNIKQFLTIVRWLEESNAKEFSYNVTMLSDLVYIQNYV